MTKSKQVQVNWVPMGKGGRTSLPTGLRYSTVSRFEEDGAKWEKEAWSIVLEFERSPLEQGTPSYGQARFLVEDAPVERLQTGRTFELFEGNKKVADVKVLSENG